MIGPQGEAVDVNAVFTEAYWAPWVSAPESKVVNRMPLPNSSSVAAHSSVLLEFARGNDVEPAVVLHEGTVLDFNDKDAPGNHNRIGAVLLVDHETLTPRERVRGDIPDKPESASLLTISARELIKACMVRDEVARTITVNHGEVSYTNGEMVFTRAARIVIASRVRGRMRRPAEVEQRYRMDDAGMPAAKMPSSVNFPKELTYRHEVGRTSLLPGNTVSRLLGLEVLRLGNVEAAKS